jgi:hypothetical protein
VPAWAGLRVEDFSWKLDDVAKAAVQAVKQSQPKRKRSAYDITDSDDEEDYVPAPRERSRGGRQRGGADESSDPDWGDEPMGGKDEEGGGGGGGGGGSASAAVGAPGANDWTHWSVAALVKVTESHLLHLLQQLPEEELAALGGRPWQGVLEALQALVTTHPPDAWSEQLRQLAAGAAL